MRNFFKIAAAACAISTLAGGCAKEAPSDSAADARLYFESWMHVNHPDLEKTGLGIYIMPEYENITEEGKAEPVADSQYVYVSYTAMDLEGNITGYTEEETARMLGEYESNSTDYFGPRIWTRSTGFLYSGVNEMLKGMGKGDSRRAIIPGWLMTYTWYSSEQDYMENSNGTNAIYDVKVIDPIDDVMQWQIDSIGRFLSGGYRDHDFGYLDSKLETYLTENNVTSAKDSADLTGFYFIEIEHGEELERDEEEDEGSSEEEDGYDWEQSHFFTTAGSNDTTIYINYVGRLLNGQVFDTNIERVAMDNGLSGGTYNPVAIQWGDSYNALVKGTDSDTPNMISGFAMTLWRMHPYGKAIGIFYSVYGYGVSGSGNSIPAFSPLMFEIEVVENPN